MGVGQLLARERPAPAEVAVRRGGQGQHHDVGQEVGALAHARLTQQERDVHAVEGVDVAVQERVVLVEEPQRGMVLGFLTRELTVASDDGAAEAWVAVYVPTNHLYLGDVLLYRRERVRYPDLTVEEGVRIFLTGGMALPEAMGAARSLTRGEPPA